VYVTYAQQNDTKDDTVAGAAWASWPRSTCAATCCGPRRARSSTRRGAWRWAADLSLAPGVLLVGNFGDGHITEVNRRTARASIS